MANTNIQIQPASESSQVFLPTKIEIGILPTLFSLVVVIATICIAWGKLKTLVEGIQKTLNEEIKPDLKNVRERFVVVEARVDTIWKDTFAPAHSPRQLNENGEKILEGSGVKEVINAEKERLLNLIKEKKITNAYDAEAAIIDVVMELPKHCPGMVEKLKTGAFRVGAEVGAVLFVGSVYLRNEIFSELGFSLDDLDKPKA